MDDALYSSQGFARVKDQIIEWMRSDIQARADELRKTRETLPEVVYDQQKKGILNLLKSMIPGSSKDIAAMTGDDGKVTTDTADIAKLLNQHWQKVFSRNATNRALRSEWLEHVRGKFRVSKEQLRPSKDIVRKVIAESGSSAPGPDSVPFEVYRSLGEVAVELFWEAANAMLDGVAIPDGDFKLALMVCIPKSADGALEDNTPFFSPSGTRPISIVDASNRIFAFIFCITLEAQIGHRISNAQKGFFKKRQMLRNVLDVDHAAQKISIRSRSGAIILFDFKAAFPSLSHDMIWDTLEATGVDSNFINVVKMFYSNNKHVLKLRGQKFDGITVESGVRQGCPLSGLLFAMCVDVLLTKLAGVLKDHEVEAAFADDIAMVVENFWTSALALALIFKEFQEISSLTLNVKKTVMIPLWPFEDKINIRRLVREFCPIWRDLEIACKGKYLGFILGPKASQDGWTEPLAKFESQVNFWATMRLGMAMNIVAFNVYIVPVLEYVAQLLLPDGRVYEAMALAMRRLASGPGNWVDLQDLENLTQYGFQAELRTIGCTAKASKLRVAMTTASDATQKCDELEVLQMEYLYRPFKGWHQRSFYKTLNDNRIEVERLGLTLGGLRDKAMKDAGNEDSFQKHARKAIATKTAPYNLELRIRGKMKRWKLDGPEATVAARIARNCNTIGRTCRPCVVGMVFRTLYNGWPTTWRMRTMPGAACVRSCVLGCSSTAVDKIEHYLVCPVAWQVFSTNHSTQLDPCRKNRQAMLLAEKGLDEREISNIGVSIYAMARTVHACRGNEDCEPTAVLRLYLAEGIRGSSAFHFPFG